jgi:hypothetical protein
MPSPEIVLVAERPTHQLLSPLEVVHVAMLCWAHGLGMPFCLQFQFNPGSRWSRQSWRKSAEWDLYLREFLLQRLPLPVPFRVRHSGPDFCCYANSNRCCSSSPTCCNRGDDRSFQRTVQRTVRGCDIFDVICVFICEGNRDGSGWCPGLV